MVDIALSRTRTVVGAATFRPQRPGALLGITVVGAGGGLRAFARGEGAWSGSIDTPARRAPTTRCLDVSSGEIDEPARPAGPLRGIEIPDDGLVTLPGEVAPRAGASEVSDTTEAGGNSVENKVADADASALSRSVRPSNLPAAPR